jgi:hypothetical protein
MYEGLGCRFDDALREFTIGMGCERYLNVRWLSNVRNTAGEKSVTAVRGLFALR